MTPSVKAYRKACDMVREQGLAITGTKFNLDGSFEFSHVAPEKDDDEDFFDKHGEE